MIKAIHTAFTGMMAARTKAHTSAANIAGATSENTVPKDTLVTPSKDGGVKTTVIPRSQPFVPSYEPGSPFADKDGYVKSPNIDIAAESINAAEAGRAFEANAAIIEISTNMSDRLIDIINSRRS